MRKGRILLSLLLVLCLVLTYPVGIFASALETSSVPSSGVSIEIPADDSGLSDAAQDVEQNTDTTAVDDSSAVEDVSSDVVGDSSDVVDDSSVIEDNSSDVEDDSSDVEDDSSDVVDDSSEAGDASEAEDASETEDGEEIEDDSSAVIDAGQMLIDIIAHASVSAIEGRVVTGIDGINLVNNAGFEFGSGTPEAWGTNLTSQVTDVNFAHSGIKSMKVEAGQSATAYAFSGINAGFNYSGAVRAGIWVNLTDAADYDKVLIVLERKTSPDDSGVANVMVRPLQQTGWQLVEIPAIAEAANRTELVIKYEVAAGNVGDVYFDDAFVYSPDAASINLMHNSSVENGDLDAFGDASGLKTTAEAHSGVNSLLLPANKGIYQASGWLPNKQSFDTPNAPLYYSLWYKNLDFAGDLTIRAEIKINAVLDNAAQSDQNLTTVVTLDGTAGDWTQTYVAIPHPGALYYVREVLFHVTTSAGTGSVYVDDFCVNAVEPVIVPPEPPNTVDPLDLIDGRVVTGIDGVNLLDYAGFENLPNGNPPNWSLTNAAFNSDTDYVHSGIRSAKVDAGVAAGAYGYSFVNAAVDKNTDFAAGMWVYLSDASDATKVRITLERPNSVGGNITLSPEAETGWQRVNLNAVATTGTTALVMKFDVDAGTAGDIYLDDAFVYALDGSSVNLQKNAGVESWGGSALNDFGGADNLQSTAEVHGGTYSIAMPADKGIWSGNSWDYKQAFDTMGDNLYYSLWYKNLDFNGELRVWAEVKYRPLNNPTSGDLTSTPEAKITLDGTAGDWTQLVATVPHPGDEYFVTEMIMHVNTGAGTGTVYVDDLGISPVDPSGGGQPPDPPDPVGLDNIEGRVVTGIDGVNLVNNAGFEYGDVDAWGRDANTFAVLNADLDFVHSGIKSLKVPSGIGDTAFAFSSLPATFDFKAAVTAGMWVYLEDAADAGNVQIVIERKPGGENLVVSPAAQTGWQQVKVNGMAIADCAELVIKFEVAAGTVGDIYFDDAFLYTGDEAAINLTDNASFETWNGNTPPEAPGFANTANLQSNAEARTGTYSLLFGAGSADVFQASAWLGYKQAFDSKGTAPLYYSAWYKNIDFNGILTIRAEVKYVALANPLAELVANHEATETLDGTAGDWDLLSVELPHPSSEYHIKEILFHVYTSAGTGSVYVDDFAVSPVEEEGPEPPDNPPPTESKEPGTVVTGESGTNAVLNPGFEVAGSMAITAGGSRNDGDTNKTHAGTGSLIFTASANSTATMTLQSGGHANSRAVVSAWVYLNDAADNDNVSVQLVRKNAGGSVVETITVPIAAKTGWQKVSTVANGRLTADCATLDLQIVSSASTAEMYVDDVFVTYTAESTESRTAGTSVTGTNGANALTNNGFESDNQDWGIISQGTDVGVAGISTATGTVHSGEKSAALAGGAAGGAVFNVVTGGLLVEAEVTVSGWVFLNDPADAARVRPQFKRESDTGVATEIFTPTTALLPQTGWQKFTITVPSGIGKGHTRGVFVIDVDAGAKAVYIDDCFVGNPEDPGEDDVGTNAVVNPGLESAGNVTVSAGVSHNRNTAGKAHAGQGSLIFTAGANSTATMTLQSGMHANSRAVVSAWVYLNNAADNDNISVQLVRKNASGTVVETITVPVEAKLGWQKVSAIANGRLAADCATLTLQIVSSASTAEMYVDDVFVTYTAESTESHAAGTSVTGTNGTNALTNNGFESDNQDWGIISQGTDVGVAGISTATGTVHSGEKSAVLTGGGAGSAVFNVVTGGLLVEAEVTVSGWVFLNDPADAARVRPQFKRESDTDVATDVFTPTTALLPQTGWQRFTISVPSGIGKGHTRAVFVIDVDAGAKAVYVDDCFVGNPEDPGENDVGTNAVVNPGLESAGNVTVSAGVSHNRNTAGKAHAGKGSLIFTAGANSTATMALQGGMHANARAVVSAWVYLNNAADSDDISVQLVRKNANGTVIETIDVPVDAKTGWQKVSAIANGRLSADCATLTLQIVSSASAAEMYVDDVFVTYTAESTEDRTDGVSITGTNGINVLTNNGFESDNQDWGIISQGVDMGIAGISGITGTTHSGAKAAVLTGGGAGSAVFNVLVGGFSVEAETTVTGWVFLNDPLDATRVRPQFKRESDTGVATEIFTPTTGLLPQTGWQRFTISVPSGIGKGHTRAVFVIDVDAGAKAVYVDDCFVGKPESPVTGSNEDKTDGASVTGQSGENAIQDGAFEAAGAGWTFTGATVLQGVPQTAHSGTGVALMPAGTSSMVYSVDSFQNYGASAIVSAWVYLQNPADASKVIVQVERNGAIFAANPQAVSGWQMVSFTVPADVNAKDFILTIKASGTSGDVYVDDTYVQRVYIQGLNYVSNGGFENADLVSGTVPTWGLFPGWDVAFDPISTDMKLAGNYAVRIYQAHESRYLAQASPWIEQGTPAYNPHVPMLFGMWVHATNLTGNGAQLKIERKLGTGTDVYTEVTTGEWITGSTNGWQYFEVYLPPTQERVQEILVGIAVEPGTGPAEGPDIGVVYVDEAIFVPTSLRNNVTHRDNFPIEQVGFNWLRNPSFELDMQDWGAVGDGYVRTESVNTGEKAMRLGGDAHIWNMVALNIDKTDNLVLSFYVNTMLEEDLNKVEFFVKREDEDNKQIVRYTVRPDPETGWQQVTMFIPSCDEPVTNLIIGADTLRPLKGSVFVDDFYLTYWENNPIEDKSNLVSNGSFEFGDANVLYWGSIPAYGEGIDWVQGVAQSGRYSLRMNLSENEGRSIFQSTVWGENPSFDKSAPLLLTGYVRTSDVTGSGVFLKVERKANDVTVGEVPLSQPVTGTNGWTYVELYVPPVDSDVEELIIGIEGGIGTGTVYIDNLRMKVTDEQEYTPVTITDGILLKNPGLETINPDGTVLHWDAWPGNPAEGTSAASVVTDDVHGGQHALRVDLVYSNAQAVYQYRVMNDNPFDFNQDYHASVWLRLENVSVVDGKGVKFGVKRTADDGTEHTLMVDVPTGTSDGWILVEIDAPKADANIIQYDVIVDIGSGSGSIWLDDFDLVQADIDTEEAVAAFEPTTPGDEPDVGEPEQEAVSSVPQQSAMSTATIAIIIGASVLVLGAGTITTVTLVRRRRLK